jgi:ABC-type nitrate/sulfonate/bicarbonate transport system substrate-binding protein
MTSSGDIAGLRVIAFPGAPNLPIFAAMEHGFFRASGVDVALETTPSSVYQFEKLAAGAFDIACTAFDNVVAYSEGQGAAELPGDPDFCVLMGATQIELSFVVAPEIETYADLKGRGIALDALSTGFAFVLYEMLARGGLEPGDYEMEAVGATPQRWQSVKDGAHAGTLTIEPFTSIALAAGFNVLDVSSNVVDSYQGGIVAASRAWAHANPGKVRGFIRGYLKGLDWTLEPANRTAAALLLLANMPAIKPGVVDAVMDSLLSPKSGLTRKGAILRDGMATVLSLRSRYGEPRRELNDIERYLDLSFYEDAMREDEERT